MRDLTSDPGTIRICEEPSGRGWRLRWERDEHFGAAAEALARAREIAASRAASDPITLIDWYPRTRIGRQVVGVLAED